MPIKIVSNIIQCKYKQIMNKIQHFPRKSGENRQGIFLFLGGGQDSFFSFSLVSPRFFVPPLFLRFLGGGFSFFALIWFWKYFLHWKKLYRDKEKKLWYTKKQQEQERRPLCPQ